MANLKRGVKLPRGSYLEIDVEGLTWRITKTDSGDVVFELYTSLGWKEIPHPAEPIQRLWELIKSPPVGGKDGH